MMDKIDRVRLRLDGRPVKGILEDKEAEVRWVDSHLEDNWEGSNLRVEWKTGTLTPQEKQTGKIRYEELR